MQLDAVARRFLLIFTLLALPFVVGSSCFVLFSSNTGSNNNDDRKDEEDDEEELVVKSGSFTSPTIEGLNYRAGTRQGITGKNGEFLYEEGVTVQFSFGDVKLGTAVAAKSILTPQDIVTPGARAETAAVNLTRLLLSLDADPGNKVITIPAGARTRAVRSNTAVASAIDFIDYTDEAGFANAASQLLATVTADYPFTVTLLDAAAVRARQNTSPAHGDGP